MAEEIKKPGAVALGSTFGGDCALKSYYTSLRNGRSTLEVENPNVRYVLECVVLLDSPW
jgi:hypothetical protein